MKMMSEREKQAALVEAAESEAVDKSVAAALAILASNAPVPPAPQPKKGEPSNRRRRNRVAGRRKYH